MGCYGYLCNGCGKSIRGGEKAVLKHIRHGQVLGVTTGTYNFYGGVEEDKIYNSREIGVNSHEEIIKSCFLLPDSKTINARIYRGAPVLWMQYRGIKVAEGMTDLCEDMYREWDTLEKYTPKEVLSGVEAWHKYCYSRAPREILDKHVLAEDDPNQSWGTPREKYC